MIIETVIEGIIVPFIAHIYRLSQSSLLEDKVQPVDMEGMFRATISMEHRGDQGILLQFPSQQYPLKLVMLNGSCGHPHTGSNLLERN